MERIALAGLSLRNVDVTVLERAKAQAGDESRFARRVADELGASELVVLSTCNRLEIAFAREEGHLPCAQDRAAIAVLLGLDEAAESALCFETGLQAARRLFRVVCSLDSLVVGEDQILAQARAAFARSEREGLCGSLLSPVFQRAFQIGKEVRTKTELTRHPVSVVSLGFEHLVARLPREQREMTLLGAGNMARLVLKHALAAGFTVRTVASRTKNAAAALAQPLGARACTLAELLASGVATPALVSATSAPGWILSASDLRAFAARLPQEQRLVALDLAVPRDLEACDDPRVEILDLETLRGRAEVNRRARDAAALEAEGMIERKLASLQRSSLERRAAATVAEVHDDTREIVERELSGLGGQRFAALSLEQRRAVEEWARAAFGRLEHAPIRAIKRWLEEQPRIEGGP